MADIWDFSDDDDIQVQAPPKPCAHVEARKVRESDGGAIDLASSDSGPAAPGAGPGHKRHRSSGHDEKSLRSHKPKHHKPKKHRKKPRKDDANANHASGEDARHAPSGAVLALSDDDSPRDGGARSGDAGGDAALEDSFDLDRELGMGSPPAPDKQERKVVNPRLAEFLKSKEELEEVERQLKAAAADASPAAVDAGAGGGREANGAGVTRFAAYMQDFMTAAAPAEVVVELDAGAPGDDDASQMTLSVACSKGKVDVQVFSARPLRDSVGAIRAALIQKGWCTRESQLRVLLDGEDVSGSTPADEDLEEGDQIDVAVH
ncbi:unnamed protein product [Pedinophyceae sp. YPF-701]|nr:unnamed protein product [Pedinophyceae sp. YPF-701]